MKNLFIYLCETLSDENKKLLLKYIEKGLIDDTDIQNIKNVIRARKGGADDALNSFLEEKGLSVSHLKGNSNFVERFVQLFANKHRYLDAIKNNGGVCTFDEFINNGKGNIFSLFCKGWEKEAQEIAEMVDVTAKSSNAAVGPYEILMKLIIKGACAGAKGDVCINENGNLIGVEVKKGGKTGARVNGQYTGAIHIMYEKFNQYIKEQFPEVKTTYNDYLQNNGTIEHIKDILDQINDKEEGVEKIIECLCAGIFDQYGLTDKRALKEISENAKKYNKKNKILTKNSINKEIFDIIGAVQLFSYQLEDGWNYITIYDGKSGDYVIFNESELSDINYVLSKLYFSAVGAKEAGSAREKTGRPCLR